MKNTKKKPGNFDEERYRTLIDKLPDYIFVHTKDGVVYVNPAAVQSLGYTKEEMLTPPMTRFIEPDSHEIIRNAMQQREAGVSVIPYEIVVIAKDGTRRTCLVQGSQIIFNNAPSTLIVLTDITGQKRVEEALKESETRSREIFNKINDAIHLHEIGEDGRPGQFIDVNDVACRMLQYSREEMLQHTPLDFATEYHSRPTAEIFEELRTVGHAVFETGHTRKDGTSVPVEINAHKFTLMGKTVVLSVVRDITERKRVDEALQESKEFLNKIINTISDPIHVKDRQHRIILINDAACRLFNLAREEIIGKTAYELFPEKEMADISWQKDEEVFRTGKESVNEETITYAPGKILTVLVKKTLYTDTAKNQFLVGITTDITEHKRADEALRESEDKYRTVFENTGTAMVVVEESNIISLANSEFAKLSGFSKDGIEGKKKWTEFVVKEDLERMLAQHRLRRQNHEIALTHYEFRFVTKSGDIRNIYLSIDVIPGTKKSVASLLDITDSKRAEETHRTLAEFQESVITNARVWLSVLDQRGKILVWNTAAEEISGYRAEEVIGKNEIWRLLYPQKEYRKNITDTINRIIREKNYLENFETTIRSRQGNEKVISWNTKGIPDATGRISDYIAIGVDITDRKQAEHALRESEEKFRTLLDNVPDLILVHRNGIFLYVNPAMVQTMGVTPDEVLNKPFVDFIVPEYRERVAEVMRKRTKTARIEPYEIEILSRTGERRLVVIRGTTIEFGGSPAVLNVLTDITERKRAEEALKKSQVQLAEAMDLAHLVTWEFDVPTGIFTFDDRFYALYGTTAEREGGNKIPAEVYAREFVHPDDQHVVADEVRKAIEATDPGFVSRVEHRIIRRDGEIRHIVVRFGITKDANGRTIRTHGGNQDITELRRAEEALSLKDYAISSSLNAIAITDLSANLIYINPAFLSILGYEDPQEVLGKSVLSFWKDADEVQKVADGMQEKATWSGELAGQRKDGTPIQVQLSINMVHDNSGKPVAMMGSFIDITERKKAEVLLKHFNEELEQQVKSRTEELNASLEEKVVLLREVHHRVKNNLQIIISLLNLQSRYMTDETMVAAFGECQNRVMAMSLVHEKLYQSADISKIDLGNYVRFLGNSLFQFFGRKGKGVTFTTDIPDISLDINTAIPVGLIINELLSNSLKYAFPTGKNGEISIAIHRKDAMLTIVYKDTGVGIPQDLDWRNAKSLGLRLVISLVEQLFGTIELDRTAGTAFTIVVKEKE